MIGCIIWEGARDKRGYGRVRYNGRPRLAHRVAYELTFGLIPAGLTLDHLCRVTSCVNPMHLEPVTHDENVRRGNSGRWQTAKTHCPAGHPYDETNTRLEIHRRCRTCARTNRRAFDERRREKVVR